LTAGQDSREGARTDSLLKSLKVFRYLHPYRFRFAGAIAFLLLSTSLGLSFPYLTGLLLDASIEAESVGLTINQIAGILLATLAVQAVFSFFSTYWFSRCGESALVDLRQQTFDHLTALPMGFFHQRRVGELVSRLSSDMALLQDTLTGATPQFIRQCTLMIGGIVMVGLTSWRLTLLMLCTFPILMLGAVLVGRRIRGHARFAQDQLAGSATVLEESLQRISDVKAFIAEKFERGRYRSELEKFLLAVYKVSRLRALLISFIILGVFGSIVGVFWYGARLMQAGELSFGELTRFILYTTFIGGSVASFADLFGLLQRSMGASERLRQITSEPLEDPINESRPAIDAGPLSGDLLMENVHFSYPSRPDVPVLNGLTLRAQQGHTIALVGASGAGKSTVFSLLLRFYDPISGTITIGGKPITRYSRQQVRRCFAVVPQEVQLFGASIAENIAYARPGASEDEVRRASDAALCTSFIQRLPDGFNTHVGERGVQLSGGQRQRVAIARAILKDPEFLLLDEATSSLDAESEHLIQQAIGHLLEDRTALVIAHRLSTVRQADCICVIEEGRVLESGSHDHLMTMPEGTYRRLIQIQLHQEPMAAGASTRGTT